MYQKKAIVLSRFGDFQLDLIGIIPSPIAPSSHIIQRVKAALEK